jgi:Kelch motif
MGMPRSGHSATLLDDGRVLVAGGYYEVATLVSSAQFYDPRSERFILTGSMNFPRAGHSAVKLLNCEF